MPRPARNVDHLAALEVGGGSVPVDPPSSAWSFVAAPADEDAGFDDEVRFLGDEEALDDWGAAGLGIP